MSVPFSTGTDWFIYDFARVYVPREGKPSARRWLEALAKGKSYITNGVFLELQADGQGVGDTIAVTAGQRLRITGRAIGRRDFRGRSSSTTGTSSTARQRSQMADVSAPSSIAS
jgi:hypothetical protein